MTEVGHSWLSVMTEGVGHMAFFSGPAPARRQVRGSRSDSAARTETVAQLLYHDINRSPRVANAFFWQGLSNGGILNF